MTRIRLGMVGGGPGSMIGPTHRHAAALDGHYDLVAGVFSRDRHKSLALATRLGVSPGRVYASFAEMAEREAARDDGVEAVSIVTRNDTHAAASIAFLERGIHVLCDKPIGVSVADAVSVGESQARTGLVFALTHNYAGYPMVREARERIAAGTIGAVRLVQIEQASGGRSRLVEAEGDAQTAWRTNPTIAGPSAVLADLGTHVHHLVRYLTGQEVAAVSASLATVVAGRTSHDDAQVILRLAGGARGALWASYVAAGNRQGLRLRVFGESGGLEWWQEEPESLRMRFLDEPERVLRRGDPWLGPAAKHATRVKAGQPEGILEAFANVYSDTAECIRAHRAGRPPDPLATTVADAHDGIQGMRFIAACIESDARDGAWVASTWKRPNRSD